MAPSMRVSKPLIVVDAVHEVENKCQLAANNSEILGEECKVARGNKVVKNDKFSVELIVAHSPCFCN
jgi:hypothetical protein